MKEKALRLLLILTGIVGVSSLVIAQGGSLSGTVTDASGNPLAAATVSLQNVNAITITDLDGNYRIQNVERGTYTIEVGFLGYRTDYEEITIRDGQNVVVDFILQEDALNLETVVISGTRYERDRVNNPMIVNVVDNKLLTATQSIAIAEGLNYQPGVRVETNCQNCGFTQVRMNGLEGSYSQILINSRPVFSALNSVYGLEQIPSNIVEQVEVVRSGGSALYGSNAIAGTINIITKEPTDDYWEIRSNTALLDGQSIDQTFNINGSIVNEELTSGVTIYGMSRNRESYDANDDGFTELVQLENAVLGAKAFFKPGERSKFTIDLSSLNEYRRGGDRLELAPHLTDITEELDHNTFMGGINYEWWSKNNRNKISTYINGQSTDRGSYYGGLGGGRTQADSVLALNAYGLTDDVALVGGLQVTHYFENDVLTMGIENQYYNTRDEIQGYSRLVDQQVNTTGLFAQYEWNPNDRFTALMGARYDMTDVNGTYQIGDIDNQLDINVRVLSPRLTLLYKINDNLRWRAGYARGFRAPQAFNEDLHISSVGGEPLFVILSQELDKETSDAYTASFNYTKNIGLSQVSLLVEGFYTQLQNPFTQVSTGSVLPNGSIIEEVRNGEGATVSGVNFEVGYSPGNNFTFQIGGTYQRAVYNEDQVLYEPENTGEEESVVIDEFVRNPNFYGYMTSLYQVNDAFSIDFTGSYTGPMTVPRVVSDSGFLDLYRSNSFFDANLKTTYEIDVDDDFQIALSGGVKNIFNSFQPEFDSGPERDSDFIYGPMAPRSVFLSVTIGRL